MGKGVRRRRKTYYFSLNLPTCNMRVDPNPKPRNVPPETSTRRLAYFHPIRGNCTGRDGAYVGARFRDAGAVMAAGARLDSIAHVCVPLFFMVTGVLLPGRDHPVASILKRIWRVVVPLVV
ncbi:MAG: hypothetical protein CPDRYMAC_4366 [uncultured Paraburkholderia sp.]|nr:MAG: hypothetical protein CPDRYDRY_4260 [uncultured Paraburkholderia sp.]CAH2936313.1 MAG: hypothetical protein CPDRYMAC_4366 [uncultured Paraburkholderia sp.]